MAVPRVLRLLRLVKHRSKSMRKKTMTGASDESFFPRSEVAGGEAGLLEAAGSCEEYAFERLLLRL